MGDGRILERTCKVPVIDTNEIHFIEIMTTINTLLGVASSIQAFYLPGEEPLPIGRFFSSLSFGGSESSLPRNFGFI